MKHVQVHIFCVLLLALGPVSYAQKKTSLIIAEYDGQAALNHIQHLVKYSFVNGAVGMREVITSLPAQKKGEKGDYVRFDIGKNSLYRDRYVITGIGNVIDMKTKKLLVADRGELIKCSGDSIIFYTNDIFKGKYYSVLDLRTEKFMKVEDPNYQPRPRPSVEVDEITQPHSISAYQTSGKKDLLVKDAGYGEAQPLLGDDVKRKFPIFWLDDKSFLYANYTKDQHKASIFKVSTNRVVEKLGEITEIPATAANAYFVQNDDGTIIYSCGRGLFSIDQVKKKAEKLIFTNLSNGFSLEADENPKYGRIIKYENVEIGKKWCLVENATTTNGHAAFQNDMVIGTERYPQGITIWNNITKKWTSLEVSSLASIIGWIEE